MKQKDYKKEVQAYVDMIRKDNPDLSKKEVNAKARDIYIKDAQAATKKALDKIKLKNYMATAPRTNLKTGGPVVNPSRMRNR
tara:strand:+ start:128 stop:373 length:246 start_codon:yes stop_codon:yes gene_type:complete